MIDTYVTVCAAVHNDTFGRKYVVFILSTFLTRLRIVEVEIHDIYFGILK